MRLIRQSIPKAKITIMTFNTEETYRRTMLTSEVDFKLSIHSFLLNSSLFKKIIYYPFFKNISSKIIDIITYFWNPLSLEITKSFIEIFSDHDIFIQAGGGYFNVNNKPSSLAHVIELEMASKAGLKILVIGQSIGGFQKDWFSKRVYNSLKLADKIIVRDPESKMELSKAKISSSILPDLAMENFIPPDSEKFLQSEIIGVILIEVDHQFMEKLINCLNTIRNSNLKNMKVKAMVSRTYPSDINITKTLTEKFNNAGISCQIVIPETWSTLQKEISECRLMISQNFHGIVMAARAGVPFIAIINELAKKSDKVRLRKFEGFLEQINQKSMAINPEISQLELLEKIENSLQIYEEIKTQSQLISENIITEFKQAIATLL
jgi:polysaccharide pyruvyl transferase WcaK-like protein